MKRLYYAIGILLALLFAWFFRDIIIYIVLAAILSFIGRPVMKLLRSIQIKNWRVPGWMAAMLTLVTIYGFIGLVSLSLVPIVSEQAQAVTLVDPEQFLESFKEPIDDLQNWLERNEIELSGLSEAEESQLSYTPLPPVILVAVPGDTLKPILDIDTAMVGKPYRPSMGELQSWMRVAEGDEDPVNSQIAFQNMIKDQVIAIAGTISVSSIINNIGSFFGNLFVGLFSVSFISFFFLKESKLLNGIIGMLTPEKYEEGVSNILSKLKPLLSRYFLGVLFEVLLVGGLLSLGLWIIGVPNAIFIGFLAGTLNVIPYLGPIIGAVLGLVFTVLSSLELGFSKELFYLLGQVLVVFGVVQIADNILFQPLIYSNSVKAHPLEIFLVILMAGTLAGPVGMILAIPVYTIFRAIAQEFLSEFKIVKTMTKGIS
ncbi:MAG: AI-2E family transporter [Bacteroidia bacterium]